MIDASTNAVIETIPFPISSGPKRVAVNTATSRVYVTSTIAVKVTVIEVTDNVHTVIATIPVGAGPEGIALDQPNNRAYVANAGSETVSVIDTTNNTVLATITVGSFLRGVTVNPNTNRAYVSNHGSHTVSVIDTSTNTVTATIGLARTRCAPFNSTPAPFGIVVNPSAPRLYVGFAGENQMCEIDTTSNGILNGIGFASSSGGVTSDIVLNPATSKIYAVLDKSSTFFGDWVGVVDANSHAKTWISLGGGANPSGLALIP